jgi:plasmid stabilization system protein ParE
MAYNVIVSPRAQMEIESAIDHYAKESTDAPFHFVSALQDAYKALSINPFYQLRYKNVRAVRIKRFPYLLYFVVNESTNRVRVLSCFHGKRNPADRPKG